MLQQIGRKVLTRTDRLPIRGSFAVYAPAIREDIEGTARYWRNKLGDFRKSAKHEIPPALIGRVTRFYACA